jgi:Gly-Xaa carboxypeptidase
MAHQDVVPVNDETVSQWTHPPFSGHMDAEGWIWGRGTTDMKSTLIALLAAAERLIEEGFEPVRPLVFSFVSGSLG